MRLIDADALKKMFNTSFGGVSHAVIAGKLIDEAPTIDPVKHGRWIESEMIGKNERKIKYHILRCSICGKSNGRKRNSYCPRCGAKMDL